MKKLGILTILVISLISCGTKKDKSTDVQLTFYFNNNEKLLKSPLICISEKEVIYFGIPQSEKEKMKIPELNKIVLSINDSTVSIAKPLDMLNSNPPKDADSFFLITENEKRLEGNVDSNNIFWFFIYNNNRNKNKLSYLINNLHLNKCK